MFKVLAIDGGGIRGAFAARFLELCEASGAAISRSFDLIVGTSTGGIIALAAAFEKPMREVAQLYSSRARTIFPRPGLRRRGGIFEARYSNQPLIDELQSVFGSRTNFAVPTTEVRVPSFNLETGYAKIFRAGPTNKLDERVFVWQVAAATSAAPTYFPAFAIPDVGLFVDGGVWANNPAIVGLTEAMALTNATEEIHILSLGTGEKSFRSGVSRSGIWSWKSDLIELVFRSQNDGVFQQCNRLHRHIGSFHRVAPPDLTPNESALDDIHAAPRLRQLAAELFDREEETRRRFFPSTNA